jgi:hypothetical protein
MPFTSFCKQPGIKMWLSLSMGIMISMTSGCGLQNADPDKLFDNTVAGLSGKDNFAFAGTTQYALNGLPSQQGVAFKGMVTGHNHLMMQVVSEKEGAVNVNANDPKTAVQSRERASSDVSVVFNRSQDQWIVTESSAASESADQLIRWNPMAHLERLNTMHKQITAARDPVTSGSILSVVPDQAQVSEMMKEELGKQIELLDPARKLQELQQKLQLTDKQTSAMHGEVEKNLADARARLEEMRNSLTAESTYVIGVDRQSNLPKTMQVNTTSHYNVGGKSKEETTQVTYSFGD